MVQGREKEQSKKGEAAGPSGDAGLGGQLSENRSEPRDHQSENGSEPSSRISEKEADRLMEQQHFDQTIALLKENVEKYQEREEQLKRESDDLYAAVTKGGETELYNQLAASLSILEHMKNTVRKNRDALNKPYFGRIDFDDLDQNTFSSLYIGKNGVSRDQEVIIVDGRAPVSSVYYENENGTGSYQVPVKETILEIPIDLKLKRTYDTDQGRLIGYYDNDVASNDDLLVKYLAKNKDAVLGDIIATIQKEQNQIIRDRPYRNIIVQGGAGSGKTTVAMHRISYILYNYEDRIHPSEFCIIGSNDMLLSYITSGLPELDVSNVRHMRMDEMFIYLLEKQWKKSCRVVSGSREEAFKSRLEFVHELDRYLEEVREALLPGTGVSDSSLGILLTADNIRTTLELNQAMSVAQLAALLNERILSRIVSLSDADEKEFIREKKKEYRKHFDLLKGVDTGTKLYMTFLDRYAQEHKENGITFQETRDQIGKNRYDVYDLAALVLIHRRLTSKQAMDEFSQIIVDEGQDFGEMVYYVLKRVLDGCYFTVMGDVSQNINYETGMNDWEALKTILFDQNRDSFRLLAKSYRNTIEISEFAGRVLEKASAGEYKIQPVIRHGRPVERIQAEEGEIFKKAAALIKEIEGRGHLTTAVICRDGEEAAQVKDGLRPLTAIRDNEEGGFQNGIMVLPISLTKGLEFDEVILWKPDGEHYGANPREAKLLYVAITRALHELFLLGGETLSPLFD